MKILILGSNGMLGSALINSFNDSSNFIFGISRSPSKNLDPNHFFQLDFMNPNFVEKLKQVSSLFKPEIIINASGLTSLLACEHDLDKARFLNGEVNKHFLEAFKNSKYFYISTDSVFNGVSGAYSEKSQKSPVNNYAISKSYGEDICLKYSNKTIILRTNIYDLSSNKGPSIVNWASSSFQKNLNITGFDDYIFNPLHTSQVSEAIKLISDSVFRSNEIYHLGSSQYISKFNFLQLLKKKFPSSDSVIERAYNQIPADGIERPMNTSLDTSKFELLFNKKFKINDGINAIF